jgi:uncharacterized protein YqhQ
MSKDKPFFYGGQAVMSGVMIRGRNSAAIAVRKPDGSISISNRPLAALYKGKWRDIPFIRGIIALIETVVLGTGALMHSAQVITEDEKEKITPGMMWGSVALGAVLAVALFFVLPLLLVRLFDPLISSSLLSNLIEGILRILFFVLYLALIGRMQDIREIFAYHGAEHMTVNTFESGARLDVESAREYSTAHTRCGTSFLLIVLVLAIVVFALLGRPSIWISILSRILLIPVIAAAGYELIKFQANHSRNPIIHWMLVPGLWLQSMTTRKPDDRQLEVAIAAMRAALQADGIVPA